MIVKDAWPCQTTRQFSSLFEIPVLLFQPVLRTSNFLVSKIISYSPQIKTVEFQWLLLATANTNHHQTYKMRSKTCKRTYLTRSFARSSKAILLSLCTQMTLSSYSCRASSSNKPIGLKFKKKLRLRYTRKTRRNWMSSLNCSLRESWSNQFQHLVQSKARKLWWQWQMSSNRLNSSANQLASRKTGIARLASWTIKTLLIHRWRKCPILWTTQFFPAISEAS